MSSSLPEKPERWRLPPRTWWPLVALLALAVVPLPAFAAPATDPQQARVELGRRLFDDERFASSKGDFATSCRSCHLLDEDPQGPRAFTDFLSRSWMPWRSADPRREHPRNTPPLLDVGGHSLLHLDGEFPDLETLARDTLTGRVLGWLPGEEELAADAIQRVLREDRPGERPSYRQEFADAFGVDLDAIDAARTLELSARAVAAFVFTLEAPRRSAWDRFVERQRLAPGPSGEQSVQEWAASTLARLETAERAGELRLGDGFERLALEGLRLFLRGAEARAGAGSAADGADRGGACLLCHAPPEFTDRRFHNIGVTQFEYDRVHGDGAFARYPLPERRDPGDDRTRRAADRRRPEWADLGRWNRLAEPSSEAGLAAFKTPTLRNLAYSSPYLHDGGTATVEEAIAVHVRAAELARRGELRAPAVELASIQPLDEAEIAALTAFLATLGDVLVPGEPLPPFPGAGDTGTGGPDNYPRY